MTGIPGIALPHSMALTAVVLAPLNRLLDFIPGVKDAEVDADSLKEKLGIFGENHVMGFIIGIFIALFAKYDFKSTVTLGVQAATALTLFPMVATLFMKALAPISDAAGEFMKSRFPGKEIYIGLDWPFLAGATRSMGNLYIISTCNTFNGSNITRQWGFYPLVEY